MSEKLILGVPSEAPSLCRADGPLSGEDPADVVVVEVGVGPDLRRDDVENWQAALHLINVMPAKAGTHASLITRDVQDLRKRLPGEGAVRSAGAANV